MSPKHVPKYILYSEVYKMLSGEVWCRFQKRIYSLFSTTPFEYIKKLNSLNNRNQILSNKDSNNSHCNDQINLNKYPSFKKKKSSTLDHTTKLSGKITQEDLKLLNYSSMTHIFFIPIIFE